MRAKFGVKIPNHLGKNVRKFQGGGIFLTHTVETPAFRIICLFNVQDIVRVRYTLSQSVPNFRQHIATGLPGSCMLINIHSSGNIYITKVVCVE